MSHVDRNVRLCLAVNIYVDMAAAVNLSETTAVVSITGGAAAVIRGTAVATPRALETSQ